MRIKHGLVSCDSHGQLNRDAFTSRMSRGQWGDLIPEVREVEHRGKMVERWFVHGEPWVREVVNCPAAMPGGGENRYPDRWEDVPASSRRSRRCPPENATRFCGATRTELHGVGAESSSRPDRGPDMLRHSDRSEEPGLSLSKGPYPQEPRILRAEAL